MKYLIAAILSLLTAHVAAQKWVKYTDDLVWSIYLDPGSLRKEGEIRRFWMLTDLKKRDEDGVLSRQVQFEHDCKKSRTRILAMKEFSGAMGGGKLLSSELIDKHEDGNVPQGFLDARLVDSVCR